jgi:hypothetical protein
VGNVIAHDVRGVCGSRYSFRNDPVRTSVRDIAGAPHTRLLRAIERGNVCLPSSPSAKCPAVQPEDALDLVRLYGETGDPKYFPAVPKWLARWIAEQRPSLEDIAATAAGFVERR